jgi:predicted transcriptional regulator
MKTVNEVMTNAVRTTRPSDVVGSLQDLMFDEGKHAVPIVESNGTLVGIVTSSDLVQPWASDDGVAQVMSQPVHTAPVGTTVADAAQAMLDHRIHHLPITDHGELVGIVSSFDLLRALTREVAEGSSRPSVTRWARPGDHIVIRGHGINQRDRRGLIVEARGHDDGPPFVVQWLDDPHAEPHDVLFFPGTDAEIEHEDPLQATTGAPDPKPAIA